MFFTKEHSTPLSISDFCYGELYFLKRTFHLDYTFGKSEPLIAISKIAIHIFDTFGFLPWRFIIFKRTTGLDYTFAEPVDL